MKRAFVSESNERAAVKARVGHLPYQDQVIVERATRILRAYFEKERSGGRGRGVLLAIMLVAPVTSEQASAKLPSYDRPHFEFWAFVDRPAFRGLEKHWGRAREMLASELPMVTTSLSVFTPDEMERARTGENHFLADKFDAGVVLYGVDLSESDVPLGHSTDVVRSMLRMALALLDRDGRMDVAFDVSNALEKVGEISPSLLEHEVMALYEAGASQTPI